MAKIYGFSIFVILTIFIPAVAGMKLSFSRKQKKVEEKPVSVEKPKYQMIDGTSYLIHRGSYVKIWNGRLQLPTATYDQNGQPMVKQGSELTIEKCAQFCTERQCTAASYNTNMGTCTLLQNGLYTVEEGTPKDNNAAVLCKSVFQTHIYRLPEGVTYEEGSLATEVGDSATCA